MCIIDFEEGDVVVVLDNLRKNRDLRGAFYTCMFEKRGRLNSQTASQEVRASCLERMMIAVEVCGS